MQEAGSRSTTRSTEIPIVDLNLRAEWVCYEATAIVNVGETGAHLLIPTTRKRRRPIVIEASSELLHQLLRLRDELPVVEDFAADREFLRQKYTELSECNGKQVNQIACRDLDIDRLKKDLVARTDQLEDAERLLRELGSEFVKRGNELAELRAKSSNTQKRLQMFEERCDKMTMAIRRVLNPNNPFEGWKTVHMAMRSAFVTGLYHSRSFHPWWSRDYWVGCPDCVPAWMFFHVDELSETETRVACYVAEAMEMQTAKILGPALSGQKNEKGD